MTIPSSPVHVSERSGSLWGALLLAAASLLLAAPAEAQSWRTLTSTRQLQGEQQLDVQVSYMAGTLELSRSPGKQLYSFELRYDEDQLTPVTEYRRGSGSLRLGVESRDGSGISMPRGSSRNGRATVALSPDVPMALQLRFGAGEARLDLGAMTLRSVDVSTGASETALSFDSPNRIAAEYVRIRSGAAALRTRGLANTRAERFEFEGGVGETVLDFGGTWTRNATASVKLGLGSMTLRFPRELGVRVVRSGSFLTTFNGEGLIKRGDEYYSPNWESAPHRLTVQLQAAFGSIDVQWID
ncbi:MAG: hypothetical protein ACR2H9_12990 [Longimicrobiaceae bacterium]